MDEKFFVFAGGIIRILVGSDMYYDNDLARFWLVYDTFDFKVYMKAD